MPHRRRTLRRSAHTAPKPDGSQPRALAAPQVKGPTAKGKGGWHRPNLTWGARNLWAARAEGPQGRKAQTPAEG